MSDERPDEPDEPDEQRGSEPDEQGGTEPAPGRGGSPVVDARGTRCPVPVIRLARAARDLPEGATVVLLADDVAAWSDVPAWARMKGHTVTLLDGRRLDGLPGRPGASASRRSGPQVDLRRPRASARRST